jgi:hypothetical protein
MTDSIPPEGTRPPTGETINPNAAARKPWHRGPAVILAIALAVPILGLARSFAQNPRLMRCAVGTVPAQAGDAKAVRLYDSAALSIWYSTEDLVYLPPGDEERSPQHKVLVFPIWARDEARDVNLQSLPWVEAIKTAIRLRTKDRKPLGREPFGENDERTLKVVAETFQGTSQVPRGESLVVRLGPCVYSRLTDTRALAAIATRVPLDGKVKTVEPTRLLLEESLRHAFAQVTRDDLRSAAIPYMHLNSTPDGVDLEGSWERLIADADAAARGEGMRSVVFGAWQTRDPSAYHDAFRKAWGRWSSRFAEDRRGLADGEVRLPLLTALVALAAMCGRRPWVWEPSTLVQAVLAIFVVSFGVFGLEMLATGLKVVSAVGLDTVAWWMPAALKVTVACAAGLWLGPLKHWDVKKGMIHAEGTSAQVQ